MKVAEEPGLDPEQFEPLISRRLDTMSDVEIRHWLRHGRGPVGEDVERLIPDRPRSAVDVFSEIERRPRLAGTLALAARLEGVLWLPSRRLERPELQGGGYTDITTRGAPERILPIQFALDGEEFIRRFAERELLYFHREEPREPSRRSWSCCSIKVCAPGETCGWCSRARWLRSRGRPSGGESAVKLATTSNEGEPVDPTSIEPAALSSLIEASDLSPHPGEALQRLLARRGRRSPGRGDLDPSAELDRAGGHRGRAAPSRATAHAGTRLFAVAVDSRGRLELAELRRGLPIVLARSRIELEPEAASAGASSRIDPVAPRPTPMRCWKGDFEPIGFPFCCGLLDVAGAAGGHGRQTLMSQSFDFDESGERILALGVGLGHLLFTCQARRDGIRAPADAGARREAGDPGTEGDRGGGRLRRLGSQHGRTLSGSLRFSVATLRDPPARRHLMPSVQLVVFSRPARDRDQAAGEGWQRYTAVDLSATGSDATEHEPGSPRRRAGRAREHDRHRDGAARLDLGQRALGRPASITWLRLDWEFRDCCTSDSARISEKSVMPLADGEPALKGGQIVRAERGGDVLAVLVRGGAAPGLYFISTSSCAVHRSLPARPATGAPGRLLCRATVDDSPCSRARAISRCARFRATRRRSSWRPGKRSQFILLSLGRSCLLVREVDEASRHVRDRCLIRWDRGRIEVERDESLLGLFATGRRAGAIARACGRGDAEIDRTRASIRRGHRRGATTDPDRSL